MSSASLIHGSYNPSNTFMDGPRLLADIGGTNARFALERAPGQIDTIQTLRCADYPEFSQAVKAYLATNDHPAIHHAAIAIANPVQGDQIKMTNHHWAFSIEETRKLLGLDTLLVVNDFTALSMALPHLEPPHRRRLLLAAGQSVPPDVAGAEADAVRQHGAGVGGRVGADPEAAHRALHEGRSRVWTRRRGCARIGEQGGRDAQSRAVRRVLTST